jgi:sigma-B regulation protein RsbU (phosphoserine phosphatase)
MQTTIARESRATSFGFRPVGRPAKARLRLAAAQWPPPGRSGDYFGVFDQVDGSSTLFFGDVSGNGSDAAPTVASLRSILERRCRRAPSPGALLAAVNDELERQVAPDRFVSAIAARIDAAGSTVQVASAGHLGPLVRTGRGQVVRIGPSGGPPLGIFSRQEYTESCAELAIGDTVIFATDGITDSFAVPADPLGENGLMERLRRWPADLAGTCRRLLRNAARGADATVLAVQVTA